MNAFDASIIRIAAWYLSQGSDVTSVEALIGGRFPNVTDAEVISYVQQAETSLRAAREFEAALPDTPLSALLGGVSVPDSGVAVSVLYTYTVGNNQRRNLTAKVLTSWEATVGDVLAEAEQIFDAYTRDSGPVVVDSITVQGGILTPSDEQV